jgi:hypothetical protein
MIKAGNRVVIYYLQLFASRDSVPHPEYQIEYDSNQKSDDTAERQDYLMKDNC